MSIVQFIQGVPLWVWILFIFFIRRGIVALSDREMTLRRLFFLPLLFLFWGGYSDIHEIAYPDAGLLMMLAGILVGGFWGVCYGNLSPRLKVQTEQDILSEAERP